MGRERSRAYPGINLEKAVQLAKMIKQGLGKGAHDRDSVSKGMGFQKFHGEIGRKIAAMVQFGLLNKKGSTYSLSQLSEKVTHPKNDIEFRDAIREAVFLPDLYKEVMEKYAPEGRLPSQLPNILHREYKITSSASHDAGKLLVESGIYAGVLDDNYQFLTSQSAVGRPEEGGRGFDRTTEEDVGEKGVIDETVETPDDVAPEDVKRPVGYQMFRFAITDGRFVEIKIPPELNAKDLAIIRKQLELFELQAEVG